MTPRRREVAELLAAGRTNKEIAAALGVSVLTVKAHVAAVLRALGCETRTEAAVKWDRRCRDA